MATMAVPFVVTDDWNAKVHDGSSAAYRISAAIKQHRNLLRAHFAFARLNRILDDFAEGFYAIIDQAQNNQLRPNEEPSDPERFREGMDALWKMHSVLEYVHMLCVRRGFGKKPLFKNQMMRLEASKEKVLDILQWMEDSLDPGNIATAEGLFSLSVEEYQRGETVTVG